jgi:hypothetical protein
MHTRRGVLLFTSRFNSPIAAAAHEIDPNYVDVTISRWQSSTNREAVLHGTAYTFDQVRAQRLGRGSASTFAGMPSISLAHPIGI